MVWGLTMLAALPTLPLVPHQLSLLLSGVLLAALMLLGLSLQLRWRQGGPRQLHHGLFFLVCAGVGVSAALSLLAGARGWALLPALGLLLWMPRTRPGRSDHWQRALACAAALALGGWAAW